MINEKYFLHYYTVAPNFLQMVGLRERERIERTSFDNSRLANFLEIQPIE